MKQVTKKKSPTVSQDLIGGLISSLIPATILYLLLYCFGIAIGK